MFNVGDEVYFDVFSGIVETDNQDGTYDILVDWGSGGGRFTVNENELERRKL